MSHNKVIEDFGRQNLDFRTPKISEVLPEYFQSDYPKLITLLDAYNEYMDSDGEFNDDLRHLLRAKDIDGLSIRFLDYLLKEIGGGITSDKFSNPRETAKTFPDFFRVKGSLFSVKSFFRALYGEEIEVTYPKDNLFIVGESKIGAESLKYIQDGALYQTLSILIKSSKSIDDWKTLYKKFVHPAGFYLGSLVLIEGVVSMSLDSMPNAPIDSNAAVSTLSGVATSSISAPFEPMTGFHQNPDSTTLYRIDLGRNMTKYATDSLSLITAQYPTIIDLATPNTISFSDSSGLTFSNTIETFDRSSFDSV